MTDAEIRELARIAASHSGQKHARIMADVERIAEQKRQERLTLGLTVEQYDAMVEPDPQPVEVE